LGLRPRSRRRRFTRSGSGRVGAGTGRAREWPPLSGTSKPPDPVRHGRLPVRGQGLGTGRPPRAAGGRPPLR
jgi:hypothetical protein